MTKHSKGLMYPEYDFNTLFVGTTLSLRAKIRVVSKINQ